MTNKLYVTSQEKISVKGGYVVAEGPVPGDRIRQFAFNEELKNFRQPGKQREALACIADSPDGMIFILHDNCEIIGYVSFHNPDDCTRWCRHPKILELGAIEISTKYRNNKLGVKLLKFAFREEIMEEKIVITTEFCWHWDLENTGLDIWSYQRMLAKLFGSVGLLKTETDEPEILEHVANVLMTRFGTKISAEDIQKFKQLQFTGNNQCSFVR